MRARYLLSQLLPWWASCLPLPEVTGPARQTLHNPYNFHHFLLAPKAAPTPAYSSPTEVRLPALASSKEASTSLVESLNSALTFGKAPFIYLV